MKLISLMVGLGMVSSACVIGCTKSDGNQSSTSGKTPPDEASKASEIYLSVLPALTKEQESLVAEGEQEEAEQLRGFSRELTLAYMDSITEFRLAPETNRPSTKATSYIKSVERDALDAPDSLVQFIENGYPQMVAKLLQYMLRGDFQAAQELDGYVNAIVEKNYASICELAKVCDFWQITAGLSKDAHCVVGSDGRCRYRQQRICPTFTIGQILDNPDKVWQVRYANFRKLGLSKEVTDCFYGPENEDKKLIFGFVPNNVQFDGLLKAGGATYDDNGYYKDRKGEANPVYSALANKAIIEKKRLRKIFKNNDEAILFLWHLGCEFFSVDLMNERYQLLLTELEKNIKPGDRIEATTAFVAEKYIERRLLELSGGNRK